MAWERMSLLGTALGCRAVGEHPGWGLGNDYRLKMAQTFKWGSNGDLPYTGPIGSTVTADNPRPVPSGGPLWAAATTRVNVEEANEMWNSTLGTGNTYTYNYNAAQAECQAALPGTCDLNWDGQTDGNALARRRVGKQVKLNSDISARCSAPPAPTSTTASS